MDNRLPAGLRGRAIFGKGNEVTIRDRIRRIRKKRRLTQAELAMMSGLSLSAIQGYEQGRYEPKRKSLESIAEVFKIPVDELYDMPAQLGTNLASLSTDCISRQAAIDGKICIQRSNGVEIYDDYAVPVEYLEQLPPAQPKRGRWHYSDGKPARIGKSFGVICDQCGKESEYCTNFCGECGADMRQKGENSESD